MSGQRTTASGRFNILRSDSFLDWKILPTLAYFKFRFLISPSSDGQVCDKSRDEGRPRRHMRIHFKGWSINGRYYDKIEACLSRLQATAMQFSSSRIGRLESVSLIHCFRALDRGKKNSRCQVEIDKKMIVLFAGDHYSNRNFVGEIPRLVPYRPAHVRLFCVTS